MTDIQPGIYRHYKGGRYRVLGVARHSESSELMVVYQSLYGDRSFWVRPQSMFLEEVELAGIRQPRFDLLSAEPAWTVASRDDGSQSGQK